MIALQHAFRVFAWFLWQCSVVGGLGAGLFWPTAVCLLTLMVLSFRKSPSVIRKRFWWLAVLPLGWTTVGLWGGYFWIDPGPDGSFRNPDWVNWPVQYGLWAFLGAAAVLIVYMRQGRAFATLFAMANLYFMLGMTLMAGMAISGMWL